MTEIKPNVAEPSIAFQEIGRQPDCGACGDYACYQAQSGSNLRLTFTPDGEHYIGMSLDQVKDCRANFRAGIKPNVVEEERVVDYETIRSLEVLGLPTHKLPTHIELQRAYRNAVAPVNGECDKQKYPQQLRAYRLITLKLSQNH